MNQNSFLKIFFFRNLHLLRWIKLTFKKILNLDRWIIIAYWLASHTKRKKCFCYGNNTRDNKWSFCCLNQNFCCSNQTFYIYIPILTNDLVGITKPFFRVGIIFSLKTNIQDKLQVEKEISSLCFAVKLSRRQSF